MHRHKEWYGSSGRRARSSSSIRMARLTSGYPRGRGRGGRHRRRIVATRVFMLGFSNASRYCSINSWAKLRIFPWSSAETETGVRCRRSDLGGGTESAMARFYPEKRDARDHPSCPDASWRVLNAKSFRLCGVIREMEDKA